MSILVYHSAIMSINRLCDSFVESHMLTPERICGCTKLRFDGGVSWQTSSLLLWLWQRLPLLLFVILLLWAVMFVVLGSVL